VVTILIKGERRQIRCAAKKGRWGNLLQKKRSKKDLLHPRLKRERSTRTEGRKLNREHSQPGYGEKKM